MSLELIINRLNEEIELLSREKMSLQHQLTAAQEQSSKLETEVDEIKNSEAYLQLEKLVESAEKGDNGCRFLLEQLLIFNKDRPR